MPMRDAAQKTDKNVNTQLILALRRDLSSGHEPRDRQGKGNGNGRAQQVGITFAV